jgi:hypothetical protein
LEITPRGMVYAPRHVTFTTGPNSTTADVYIPNWVGNSHLQYVYNVSIRKAGY